MNAVNTAPEAATPADGANSVKRRTQQKLEVVHVDDALLKLSTASQIAGISEPTIYRRAASDPTFPKLVRLGARCTRIRAGDLRRWLAEQAAA